MYAAAYFESDPRKIVEAGLAVHPCQKPVRSADQPTCSPGPNSTPRIGSRSGSRSNRSGTSANLAPKARSSPLTSTPNSTALTSCSGLLYGERDMGKTIEISTRAGQDSDCNPASAAGILGVMLGYKAIPDAWKGGIPAIADKKFNYTDFTFQTICQSTEKQALALVRRTGGSVNGDKVVVNTQAPKPASWKSGTITVRPSNASPPPIRAGNGRVTGRRARPPAPQVTRVPRHLSNSREPEPSSSVLTSPPAARPTSISMANSSRLSMSIPTRTTTKAASPSIMCFA